MHGRKFWARTPWLFLCDVVMNHPSRYSEYVYWVWMFCLKPFTYQRVEPKRGVEPSQRTPPPLRPTGSKIDTGVFRGIMKTYTEYECSFSSPRKISVWNRKGELAPPRDPPLWPTRTKIKGCVWVKVGGRGRRKGSCLLLGNVAYQVARFWV